MTLGNTENSDQVAKTSKLTSSKLLRVIVQREAGGEKRPRLSLSLIDSFVDESGLIGVPIEIKTPVTSSAESLLLAIIETEKGKSSPSSDTPLLTLP